MQLYFPKGNLAPLRPRRRYPLARRHTKILERMHQEATQRLVSRVEGILVGVGLAQFGNSVAGGRTTIIPKVVSVAEEPMRFTIRTLPGQIPDDFVAAAERIAYNLDVAEVHVVPLGPSLIQLILLPRESVDLTGT
jgi:hypothetical protein